MDIPHPASCKVGRSSQTDHFAPVSRVDWVVPMVKEFLEAPMQETKPGENPKHKYWKS